jgi:hypothetical protein
VEAFISIDDICSSRLHRESRYSSYFSLLTQRKVSKRKGARAEAFLQLTLQNHSKQPKSGPRLPAFLTVAPPYAGT